MVQLSGLWWWTTQRLPRRRSWHTHSSVVLSFQDDPWQSMSTQIHGEVRFQNPRLRSCICRGAYEMSNDNTMRHAVLQTHGKQRTNRPWRGCRYASFGEADLSGGRAFKDQRITPSHDSDLWEIKSVVNQCHLLESNEKLPCKGFVDTVHISL